MPFAAVAFASVRHTAELPTSFVAVAGDSVGSDHRSRGRIASDSNRDGVVHVRDIRSIAPHFRSRKDHDVSVEDVNGDSVADISDR